MSSYSGMDLSELKAIKKELIAKCRAAQKKNNKSLHIKTRTEVDIVKDLIEKQEAKEVMVIDAEKQRKIDAKEENNQIWMSGFGFIITSHALRRYRLRYNKDISLNDLYETMKQTKLVKYIGALNSGKFPISDDCVAVVEDKRIVTFKNPKTYGLEEQ